VTSLEGPGVGETTPTSLHILNGGGTAKNVACLLAKGGCYFAHPLGPGFLRNKEKARVQADLPPDSDERGLLTCRDLKQKVWVWDLDGKPRTYDARKTDPASDLEMFWRDFYGETLSRLERVASIVKIE